VVTGPERLTALSASSPAPSCWPARNGGDGARRPPR